MSDTHTAAAEEQAEAENPAAAPAAAAPAPKPKYGQIIRDGLWDNNVALGQILALCPLMAVTTSATNGLGMGIATILVLVLTNFMISSVRGIITPQVRIPVMIVIIAAVVTIVDMSINAWMHSLYKVLGLFIALIVTNCAIFGRAEAFAIRNPILPSMADALGMGIGFTLVLVAVGGVREILGSGTLFSHASLLLGSHFAWMEIVIIPDFPGILLAILPPGAFITLGFLIAAKRAIDARALRRKMMNPPASPLVMIQN